MLALGLDIGGTKSALGLVDLDVGVILRRTDFETPPRLSHEPAFFRAISQAAQVHGDLPLGIGLCELVDREGGIVNNYTIPWSSAELRAFFPAHPKLVIEADVRAAARAEAIFGAGRALNHWIYANAGTGIGAVLMQGAIPYLGNNGLGMAFGMSPAAFDGASTHTLEDLAGTRGMAQLAGAQDFRKLAETAPDHAVLRAGGAALGRALATLANMLDPEAIVFGGGAAAANTAFVDAAEQAFRDAHWFHAQAATPVMHAGLGADAGVIGAALLAQE
jgi:glucokinase